MSTRRRPPASLLTLPSELRNAIYLHIFAAAPICYVPLVEPCDPLAKALQLSPPALTTAVAQDNSHAARLLGLLQTCRQIHAEAHLLALAHLAFHLRGECADPELFAVRASRLPRAKLSAVRTLTLTARISHLRALNEAWAGLPFGDAGLRLDTLVLVPFRPDVTSGAFREIAGLSQCHTLAYILGETLKGLRNVGMVEVRNAGCFEESVWERCYSSVLYRLWRWGGGKCGIRFVWGPLEEPKAREDDQWFRAYLQDGMEGAEVGEEVCRLVRENGEYPFDPASTP